jgi:hypothetical protein
MKKFSYHTIFCLAILFAPLLQAKIVPNLYQVMVPVSSQAGQLRQQAIDDAFKQILIRVSGNSQIMQNSDIEAALKNANQYMQQYSYTQTPLTGTEADNNPGATRLVLQVVFDPAQIKQLLQQVAQPVWGRDRPTMLIWVVEGDSQNRHFVSLSTPDKTLQMIQQLAQQRGLPLVWPAVPEAQSQDTMAKQPASQDNLSSQASQAGQQNNLSSSNSDNAVSNNSISLDDVWQPNLENVQHFSQTYGADVIAIVRIFNNANQWDAQWTLIVNNEKLVWQSSDENEWTVVQQGITNIADALGQRFAVEGTKKNNQVTVTITNLTSLSDFVMAQKYLRQLTPVHTVELKQIDSDAAQFAIVYEGSQSDFVKAIQLDKKLMAVQPEDSEFNSTLNYQWQ